MNGLPEITVRTGLAYGFALVVLYGKNLETAHIDIIGSSISMAAKIASTARASQILVGEHITTFFCRRMLSQLVKILCTIRVYFFFLGLDKEKWKYLSRSDPGSIYRVYEYLETY